VWALALRKAQDEAHQAKDEAQAEVAAMRGELAEARNEITLLEGVETSQAATIDQATRGRAGKPTPDNGHTPPLGL